MKKQSFLIVIFIIIGAIGMFSSCSKTSDVCANVTCQNGGYCLDGNCKCITGYSGAHCENTAAQAFLGKYVGVSTTGTGATNDTVIVSVSAHPPLGINISIRSLNATVEASTDANLFFLPSTKLANGAITDSIAGAGKFTTTTAVEFDQIQAIFTVSSGNNIAKSIVFNGARQ